MKIAGAFVKRRNVVRSIFFSHKNPPTFQVRQNHLHRPLDGTQIFRDDIQRGTAKCRTVRCIPKQIADDALQFLRTFHLHGGVFCQESAGNI